MLRGLHQRGRSRPSVLPTRISQGFLRDRSGSSPVRTRYQHLQMPDQRKTIFKRGSLTIHWGRNGNRTRSACVDMAKCKRKGLESIGTTKRVQHMIRKLNCRKIMKISTHLKSFSWRCRPSEHLKTAKRSETYIMKYLIFVYHSLLEISRH